MLDTCDQCGEDTTNCACNCNDCHQPLHDCACCNSCGEPPGVCTCEED